MNVELVPSNLVLAYCAGVIDSDGCIGVRRSTYAMRVIQDCTQPTYSERVCVKQVEIQAVSLLHEHFGGYLQLAKPYARRGRPLHSWQVTDQRAARCLRLILPFLRIKAEQARNGLWLRGLKDASKLLRIAPGRGHAGSAPRTPEMSAAMDAAYQRAKLLNMVGVR